MINKVYNGKEIIYYYVGRGSHSFRDYKADDRKSLPRITRRRLQEFILFISSAHDAQLEWLRRQPGGGFCSKRLYSGRGWNAFSSTTDAVTEVEECAF